MNEEPPFVVFLRSVGCQAGSAARLQWECALSFLEKIHVIEVRMRTLRGVQKLATSACPARHMTWERPEGP